MLAAQAEAACPLLQLSDDVLEAVGHQISDALQPAVAGALAACNHNLWRVMRTPLAKLQPRHAVARALAAKVGYLSCAELIDAWALHWMSKDLDAADMATLVMLFSTGALASVERLRLDGSRLGPAGASALLAGLGGGDAPRLTRLNLYATGLGNEGAATIAAALSHGALPKLEALLVGKNRIGDEGMAALAVPLRRRPALKNLLLHFNRIGDAGVAALLDNLGAKEFKQLEELFMAHNQVGDAGFATLAAALDGATLPALRGLLRVHGNPASAAAQRAVQDAVRANAARAAA